MANTSKSTPPAAAADDDMLPAAEVDEEVATPLTRTVRMRMSGEALYGGVWYTLEEGKRITVPTEVAEYWIAHNMTFDN